MFKRAPDQSGPTVKLRVDDVQIEAHTGDTVAAALLVAGVTPFRKSAVGGGGRGPYCMMGICFECLVSIDGVPSRQSCLVPVRDGMEIKTAREQGTSQA